VEQVAASRLAHADLPAEVDGSPTAVVEEGHVVVLSVECRPGGT
jgi:hypothetical protein